MGGKSSQRNPKTALKTAKKYPKSFDRGENPSTARWVFFFFFLFPFFIFFMSLVAFLQIFGAFLTIFLLRTAAVYQRHSVVCGQSPTLGFKKRDLKPSVPALISLCTLFPWGWKQISPLLAAFLSKHFPLETQRQLSSILRMFLAPLK